MKTYTAKLKGTKKTDTKDLSVIITATNKSQAFAMAYTFFEKGEVDTIFGTQERGFSKIEDYIPSALALLHLAGKYKVYSTSIVCG